MDEFLQKEFNKLRNENVISAEIYSKIIDYYENNKDVPDQKILDSAAAKINLQSVQNKAEKQSPAPVVKNPISVSTSVSKQKKETKKINFQMILSIVASLLIGGGIISLIAYNWNAIPRFAKSIAAFIICIMAPVSYAVLTKLRKTEFEQKSKEFFAILWNLLFGGSIAFVSQTYRMASAPVAFFVIWLFISIGITYALKSYGSFCISLLLTIVYCIYSQQFTCNIAAAFYPAMFLNYFFAKKNKKCFYAWLIELISMIGFVLEKCLPGLWIIAYVSVNVLLLTYAEKENDKTCRILGYIQATALAVILAIPYFWEKIGFAYYRDNARYNRLGGIADYIVTLALYAGSFWFTISSVAKNVRNKLSLNFTKIFELIILITIAGLYFCGSFISGFSIFIPRIFLLLYFALFFYSIIKNKKALCAISFALIMYGIFLGRINFIFAFVYSVLLACCAILQKFKSSETRKKFSVSLIYILILISKVCYSHICDFIISYGSTKRCKFFDLIIASVLMTSAIAYLAAKNINFKNITVKQIFSKFNFYIAAVFLGTICILFNYDSSQLNKIIDIFITITAVLSCIDFVINKSVQSYFGLALFVINYFFSLTDANGCIFIFAISYLILYAVHYYLGENFRQTENYNYFHAISYFLIFIFNYSIFYNNFLKDNIFNPFISAKSGTFFILMLSILFIIPVFMQIKEKKLNGLFSLAAASVSVIFLIFNRAENIFNTQSFIFSVLIICFFISLWETVINKKLENLIMLAASLIVCFVEISSKGNYLNGVTFVSMLIFALQYYVSYLNQNKKKLQTFITVCSCFLLFIAFVIDINSSLENEVQTKLFSSVQKIISTAIMIPVLIGIPTASYIKNKENISLSSIAFAFVSVLFYLLNDYCRLFNAENYLFALSFAVSITSFIDTFVFSKKSSIFLFALSLFDFIRFGANDNEISVFMLTLLFLFAILIYSKILIGDKGFISGATTFVISTLLITSMCFSFNHSFIEIDSNFAKYYISISIALTGLFVIPCIFCIKKKLKINYVEIAFCLSWIVNFVLFSANKTLNVNVYQEIFSGISLGLIIAFSIFGLYLSYEKSSIKSANYYLIFLSLSFIIRFFMMSKGLVERGLVCIICGICILIVNMIFSKKINKAEEPQIEQGEEK